VNELLVHLVTTLVSRAENQENEDGLEVGLAEETEAKVENDVHTMLSESLVLTEREVKGLEAETQEVGKTDQAEVLLHDQMLLKGHDLVHHALKDALADHTKETEFDQAEREATEKSLEEIFLHALHEPLVLHALTTINFSLIQKVRNPFPVTGERIFLFSSYVCFPVW